MSRLTVIAAILLTLPVAMAAADEVLQFDSPALFGLQQTISAAPTVSIGPPLAANLVNAHVVPVSWYAICITGCFEISSDPTNAPVDKASFWFSTNGQGSITGWSFDIASDCCAGTANNSWLKLASSTFLGQSSYAYQQAGASIPSKNDLAIGGAGTWTATVKAPELDPRGVGAGMTFLLGLLAVARGRAIKA